MTHHKFVSTVQKNIMLVDFLSSYCVMTFSTQEGHNETNDDNDDEKEEE